MKVTNASDATAEMCKIYVDCMEEIGKRQETITDIVSRKYGVKYVITTVDTVALQLRKVLEIIALASLVANREEYSKVGRSFRTDWNAKAILQMLEEVKPRSTMS